MNRLRFFVIVHKRSAEKANNQRSIDKFEWICYDNFEKEYLFLYLFDYISVQNL